MLLFWTTSISISPEFNDFSAPGRVIIYAAGVAITSSSLVLYEVSLVARSFLVTRCIQLTRSSMYRIEWKSYCRASSVCGARCVNKNPVKRLLKSFIRSQATYRLQTLILITSSNDVVDYSTTVTTVKINKPENGKNPAQLKKTRYFWIALRAHAILISHLCKLFPNWTRSRMITSTNSTPLSKITIIYQIDWKNRPRWPSLKWLQTILWKRCCGKLRAVSDFYSWK